MDRFFAASALWAMHPGYLNAMLKSGSIENMLPESIQGFAAMMSGSKEAAKPADPIREGSTLILPITGTLAPQGLYGSTYYNVLADRVREAAADTKIGAIVMPIRSPGGYVWGCAECGDAIFEARQSKPIVAVADPYCFSAAYWLATQASAFYATTSGEVGSVGVRSGHTDMSGFEDKIGMKTTLVASHPDKIAGNPHGPLADEDRAEIQQGVDESNVAFAAAIARGRNMRASEVAAVHGTGKTFSAQRAMANGAIDGVKTLREVVAQLNTSRARLSLMRRQAAAREMALSI
ncbi:S49 family peptidase [Microvirga sp. SRT01]|uniref:S49 family peptidase n=1 Tax=Sphingomonas longa TaxID=2778730 RepID=A0ABS2D602_9SPHN|nr:MULTISPECIES: S49 family peptidase [Alphaproteobacteria]MBM6576353.1 S49 family peptidase [Sphingomonas sp. BT552]MBR7709399.1 S49 family peptidase [Microvirga sp. SRT01]